jgi:hypothetical protein
MSAFAQQIREQGIARRFKAIGHTASEGFSQHYNDCHGHYLGYVETVNNWGLGYRAYPAKLETGRLFDSASDAVDYLIHTAQGVIQL